MTALADQIGAWIGAQPVETGVDGRAMLAAILERWPDATADDINLAITIGIETRTDTLWRGLLAAGGAPN